MKVCIAEKPSVAREIAQVVGAKSRKDGYMEGNGYAVTWTFGHFCTLLPPEDYKPHWKKWDLNSLPMLPEKFKTKLINDAGVKKQFKVIKSLLQKAKLVINCGDAGQEGELIQRWVLNEAKYKGEVQRLWISSLTNEAIRAGFKNLKPASDYDPLFYAGSARAVGDWLLGMNATRLYTLKYGAYKQVLSIGRVQTPTLAMIVNRHLEIINFISKPFWELQTTYRDTSFSYSKGRFTQKEDGQELFEKVKKDEFTITKVNKKNGKEYSPKLFDLTSLQVFCNKRYSYSADQTLKLVQKLYEMKVVTYPRVDTQYLPNDQYPKIKSILQGLKAYTEFTAPLLSKPIKKSKSVFDDSKITDHHAIIPTGKQAHLNGGHANVYDAICRRFIANFYPECKVANTNVIGTAAGLEFKATGKEILEPGWKVLYPKKKNKNEEEDEGNKKSGEKILPSFTVGESGPHVPNLVEKKTQPPKYYTEATLLRGMETAGKSVDNEELRELMKANGIGRPSTRSAIIETLFKRKYIKKRGKQLHPTEVGVGLIQIIENEQLKSVELTGTWERQLREIEAGTYNPKSFILNMKEMVDDLVTSVRLSKNTTRLANLSSPTSTKSKARKKGKRTSSKKDIIELHCPKCKLGKLLKGNNSYGCSTWKDGCTFRLPFLFMGKKFTTPQLKRLVEKGCTTNLKGFKSGDEKIDGLVRFDENYNLKIERPKSKTRTKKINSVSEIVCPKCKDGKLLKGKTAYGCSQWKQGCKFVFSFDEIRTKAKGKSITPQLINKIIQANGKA